MNRIERAADVSLILGASLRLTRFVVSDSLGGWVLVEPAQRWVERQEPDDAAPSGAGGAAPPGPSLTGRGWRRKLVSGLDCPACAGYWLGVGVLASYLLAKRSPRALAAWRFLTGGLSLNYVVHHTVSRLD